MAAGFSGEVVGVAVGSVKGLLATLGASVVGSLKMFSSDGLVNDIVGMTGGAALACSAFSFSAFSLAAASCFL